MFALHRVVFLVVFGATYNAGFVEALWSFWYGLPLDLSMAAYLSVLPVMFLMLAMYIPSGRRVLTGLLSVYFFIALILAGAVQSGDIGIYPEWQTKLPLKAVEHLADPKEPFMVATPLYFAAFFVPMCLYLLTGILLWKKWVKREFVTVETIKASPGLFIPFVLIAGVLVLLIRGGLGQFPVSLSSSYYSPKTILNDAAVNSPWQFAYNVIEGMRNAEGELYHYYPKEDADETTAKLIVAKTNSFPRILKTERPNIVMFILESWSADCIASLGGYPDLTPNFDSLSAKGMLFTNFYANSWTSEKGNASILGAFPAFPIGSVMTQSTRFRQLPAINQGLQTTGYNTSYYYGSYLNFANIKGFLLDHNFGQVVDMETLPGDMKDGSLGVHDGAMMNYWLEQIKAKQQPFFTALFTVSTHSPYDIPSTRDVGWGDSHRKYLNATVYADSCIGDFIAKASKEPWYDNTLFVFVADHSHNSPKYFGINTAERYRIPLLFFGNAIKEEYRGKPISVLGSQKDIAATLLAQVNIPSEQFTWSNNLLQNDVLPYVPYAYPSGLGWIDTNGYFAWDVRNGSYYPPGFDTVQQQPRVHRAKSYFQTVYRVFEGY